MLSENKPWILIVEDDLSSQQFFTTVLEETYNLEILPTAQAARDVLGKRVYGMIIVDISLPGDEDGIGLLRHIRKTLRITTPILIITANAQAHSRSGAIGAGANEYFTKPILAGTLIEALNKYKGEDHG